MFKKDKKINKASISKNAIYEKSINLFSKKGIDNVTMRDLARACDLSPGAFYYHYKSKDDLILQYYKKSLADQLVRGEKYLLTAPKNLALNMKWLCTDRFEEFAEHRSMLRPFVTKIDLSSPISPMSPESFQIRRQSVAFFTKVASHSLNTKGQMSEIIGRLLWIHHLLILSLWLRGDEVSNKGILLLDESKKLWRWVPTFLKLPGIKRLLTKVTNSLKRIGLWEDYND